VAFDAKPGRVAWAAARDGANCSSCVLTSIGGQKAAVFLTRNGITSLEPATARVLFQLPWRSRSAASVNAASPLVVGDVMFISAEYGRAAAFQLNGSAPAVSSMAFMAGRSSGRRCGPWTCVPERCAGRSTSSAPAASRWAGARLLIVRESGELVLAAANSDAFTPIARAQVLPATIRALPAIADGFVYLRNEKTLMCLDLRGTR
jgi:outer membrane protein assembly factor BamB